MSACDDMDLLQRRGWLAHTPPDFRARVAGHLRLRDLREGELLYTLGEEPGGIWGLVGGGLAIEVAPNERGPSFAYFAQPGFWFGEQSLITRRPRLVSVRATRRSRLAGLSLAAFDEMARDHPADWRWIALLATMNTALAIAIGDDLMIRDPRLRLIALLLRLAGLRGVGREDGAGSVMVSQTDLAAMAAMTRTTAGLILRDLARREQIVLAYRRIDIVDGDGLSWLVLQSVQRS